MSKIEWTGKTWNPIAGCTIVSPGCKNCYAMKMAGRLEAMGQSKYVGLTHKVNGHRVWTGKITLDDEALTIPLKRRRRRRGS
jgi:protein gp37